MSPEDAELCRLAEKRFREDRDSRTRRCPCNSYHSQLLSNRVVVKCMASNGLPGCGYEVWYPFSELRKTAAVTA